MISYIVASHRPQVLQDNLQGTVRLVDDDEFVVVENPPSIAVAYNEGQSRATQPIRCYVHQDVKVVDPARLRAQLIEHCTPSVGFVGVVGSRVPNVPWWSGKRCGSVWDARAGVLDFGTGGECAYLDGLLLATAHTLTWDEAIPGFHLYDHDGCQQMLDRGLTNLCLTGGHEMVHHITSGPTDEGHVNGWAEAAAVFAAKLERLMNAR